MNQWNKSGYPHKGWNWESVTDLEEATHVCEMCDKENIRYVHTMRHSVENISIDVGCICAEKLSEDYTGLYKEREKKLRGIAQRKKSFLSRKWKHNLKKNSWFLDIDGITVTIFPDKFTPGKWKYVFNNKFSDLKFDTVESAQLAAFDAFFKKSLNNSDF